MSLLIRNARVLTMGGPGPRRGARLGDLGVISRADVLVEGGVVAKITSLPAPGGTAIGSAERNTGGAGTVIDAAGRVLMPAFVDCHTHACWAGDRLDEWQMKLRGAAYLDILKAGGGIMSTVRSVRAASESQLAELLLGRLTQMLKNGTTTVEVKSGYGLSTEAELKMLRAIRAASARWPGTVVMTALLGHAIDADTPDFVEKTVRETLPAVSAEFPGIAIDAFCEKGAWSLNDCVRLFESARSLAHPIRVHADQFNSMGMVGEATRLGAVSVDHLEATTAEDAARLAASQTFGVALPCSGLHLSSAAGGQFANLRRLADAGGQIAIATNCNPGSSPTTSVPLAMGTAVRFCGLSPAEAIVAGTAGGAGVLGLTDRGWIGAGAKADLILLRHTDERMLPFELGGNPVDTVLCAGRIVP